MERQRSRKERNKKMPLTQVTKKMNITVNEKTYKDVEFQGYTGETLQDFLTHPFIGGRSDRAFGKKSDLDNTGWNLKGDAKAISLADWSKLDEKSKSDFVELESLTSCVTRALDLNERNEASPGIRSRLEGPSKAIKQMAEAKVKLSEALGKPVTFADAVLSVVRESGLDEATSADIYKALGVDAPKTEEKPNGKNKK